MMSKLMSSTSAFSVALCWPLVHVTSRRCLLEPSTMEICSNALFLDDSYHTQIHARTHYTEAAVSALPSFSPDRGDGQRDGITTATCSLTALSHESLHMLCT